MTVDFKDSVACPELGGTSAVGYAVIAAVVPTPSFHYLTLISERHRHSPNISTLNSVDRTVASNMAIVPTSNGLIDAYAAGGTELVLDVYGFFFLKAAGSLQ